MPRFLALADAIAEYVHDGDTVAMEGFTHLIPFAAGHEVTQEGYALGFRFDIVLHGPNATPFEPYEAAQRATR